MAASFVFASLNRMNIVEDTAIFVFHVRVIVLHVRRHSRFMSLAVRAMRACAQGGSGGPCPPGGVCGRAFAPPGKQGGSGGGTPPNVWSDIDSYAVS